MNKPRKECGTCKFWHKRKNHVDFNGLCEYHDFSTDAQQGRGCQEWRANKHHRKSVFYDDYVDPELMKHIEEFMEEHKDDFKALADC
ncbi:hypothetical protein b3_0070 [Synechococcus phage B3]|nr:hypothetical protein b3_0070 [Synechococcus phage B3]QGT54686.1 hypothetical protein b23_0069 [Synechococcus phage B23]